jgi:hypothetical protein
MATRENRKGMKGRFEKKTTEKKHTVKFFSGFPFPNRDVIYHYQTLLAGNNLISPSQGEFGK